ncbi:MAG: 2-oxoglutarate dehydrogenase E1 component [Vicinamibacterales bacterium]
MADWRDFQGINAGYIAELYERFQVDPGSLDTATRAAFAHSAPPDFRPATTTGVGSLAAVVGAVNLAECIRRYGHLGATIDPLGTPPVDDPALHPRAHGVTEDDLRRVPAELIGGPCAAGAANAFEAIERLRRVYCSTVGYDYAHIFIPEEREWLRQVAEAGLMRPPLDPVDVHELLDRLTQVEAFERFLHRAFPGKTRFSLEGLDTMIPILDEIVADAGDAGIQHVLIGMAHRGRLNVLAHVLQKPYVQVLAEFKDPIKRRTGYRIDLGWTGDVKYHSGARTVLRGDGRTHVQISMAPNPSHLEAVNPVVAGMARAAGTTVNHRGEPTFDPDRTLPLLIHGDAAFPGQGVVAETLNLSRLTAYTNGGTIHIIANNQLGFTATPDEAYSTSYASGLARGFKVPVVHVNADDPEACIEVARLAWAYRAHFKRDFLIDLVGYRRYGHNEGDEPAFTQPVLYKRISVQPTARERWIATLEQRGLLGPDEDALLVQKHQRALEEALESLKPERDLVEPLPESPQPGAARAVQTAVPLARLAAINDSLLERPDGFVGHKKLERTRERRRVLFKNPAEPGIDWATAEELAFASLLEEGIPIRLTGEDAERGTFSQRHAVFHDAETGARHVPLQALPQATASFEVCNSPISELAAVGFEFGYNVQEPGRLVIWEAQYGDFINGAQLMIDEFITSARAKWGQTPSLVLLLPHGYEGQGPDHSSARPERFLQSAADINLRLANCTTAAQYFHLLRRQALLLPTDPLPLIVLTPKSLLRHPGVASAPNELAAGKFQPVLDDVREPGTVDRVIFCSGKVYFDLVTSDLRTNHPEVAVVRLEQLYPFPHDEVARVLERYAKADVVWLQEEPANMGSWEFIRPLFEGLLDGKRALRYVGRPRSASPSEGSSAWHAVNQRAIVEQAFTARLEPPLAVVGR